MRLGGRRPRHLVLAAVAAALVAPLLAATRPGATPPLFSAGLLGNDRVLEPIPPADAKGAAYVPGSNVLRLPDGRYRYLPPGATDPITVPGGPSANPPVPAPGTPDPDGAASAARDPASAGAADPASTRGSEASPATPDPAFPDVPDPSDPGAMAAVTGDRAWLAEGSVPGRDARQRAAAERALLDLRLLLRPGGAALAAQTPYWAYVWPRDASFVAAAFAVTGHAREALEALEFLGRTQRPDGTWPARSRPDGTPVTDSRPAQLDGTGWVPWAAWLASDQGRDRPVASRLWPAVRAAATAAARSLGPDGLPPAVSDYWERPEGRPTLGTAAALRAGLRAAGDLAAALHHPQAALNYRSAAARLGSAIGPAFWGPAGFHRYPVLRERRSRTRGARHFGSLFQQAIPARHRSREAVRSRSGAYMTGVLGDAAPRGDGPDAAVTWLGPPFAPPSRMAREGLARAAAQLAPGNGGAVPGTPWRRADYWTPATASFALAEMASGDRLQAERRLDWLLDHRTALGAFPERVRRGDGSPRSAAPLAWTDAIVLLTLAAGDRPLPIPGR